MIERIRYGSEYNIFSALGQTNPDLLRLIQKYNRNILSFSDGVRHLPNEPEFGPLLNDLGFECFRYGINSVHSASDELTDSIVRVIEIIDAPQTNYERIKLLGDGLVSLAVASGKLDDGGVIFFDHSADRKGKVIASYNANLD